MPRSPLTETIKRADDMVHYVQDNLSAEEYMLFLDMVDPLPEPAQKPAKKKSSKKSAGGGGGRSSRGESLKQQISNRAQSATRPSAAPITDSDNNDDGNAPRCQAKRSDGRICMLLPDHNIHHLTTVVDHHPFVSTAQTAEPSSNQATSETGKGGAGDAHHAASSGD